MEMFGVYLGLGELVVISLGLAMGGAFGFEFYWNHHR